MTSNDAGEWTRRTPTEPQPDRRTLKSIRLHPQAPVPKPIAVAASQPERRTISKLLITLGVLAIVSFAAGIPLAYLAFDAFLTPTVDVSPPTMWIAIQDQLSPMLSNAETDFVRVNAVSSGDSANISISFPQKYLGKNYLFVLESERPLTGLSFTQAQTGGPSYPISEKPCRLEQYGTSNSDAPGAEAERICYVGMATVGSSPQATKYGGEYLDNICAAPGLEGDFGSTYDAEVQPEAPAIPSFYTGPRVTTARASISGGITVRAANWADSSTLLPSLVAAHGYPINQFFPDLGIPDSFESVTYNHSCQSYIVPRGESISQTRPLVADKADHAVAWDLEDTGPATVVESRIDKAESWTNVCIIAAGVLLALGASCIPVMIQAFVQRPQDDNTAHTNTLVRRQPPIEVRTAPEVARRTIRRRRRIWPKKQHEQRVSRLAD